MSKKVKKIAFLSLWKELLITFMYIKMKEKHLIFGIYSLINQKYRKQDHVKLYH
jgi:hypothetical protein